MSWIPLDNFRSPPALLRFFLTMVLGLALDLGTKHLAFAYLCRGVTVSSEGSRLVQTPPGDPALAGGLTVQSAGHLAVQSCGPCHFIPGWLDFNITVNQGAVFGKGQGLRWLFLAVSVLAILFLTYLFATSDHQKLYQFTLGLLLAGVLGNMYDRVVYGYVRDMIHALPGWRNPFPFLYDQPEIFPWIFNVADCLLCVGVGLIIVQSLFHRPAKAPRHVPGETPS